MTWDHRYDYVIVGAGSSGAALAGRLSEVPGTTVLLLEAGPDYRSAESPHAMRSLNPGGIQNPQRFPQFQQFHWMNLVARRTPQQEPFRYERGRGVGGSSAINTQMAIRGMPGDFDRWAEQGCTGWSWADVLPAFDCLEDDLDFGDAPYHGRGGPIPIYRTPENEWGAVDRAIRDAALDLGYGWCDDHNAPDGTGVSPFAITGRDNARVSTNDAYLEPARNRSNLRVLGDALVERVLFDGGRAAGVRVRAGDDTFDFAAGEVILAAGVFHSPAILLRSGIGPPEELARHGIDVFRELPVGRNLCDHPGVFVYFTLRPKARCVESDARMSNCLVRYTSRLAGAGCNDMSISGGNMDGYEGEGLAVAWVCVVAFQSFSHGLVRLAATDPRTDPEIDLDLLRDERDLVRLRDGMRRLDRVLRHPAMAAIVETCDLPEISTLADADLEAWLFANVRDALHAVGTCRMGAPDDPRSVVDPECQVIGVEGLRVVDASIMPEVPRANTHLTCVMIAEHMADHLRSHRAGQATARREPAAAALATRATATFARNGGAM